MKTVMDKDVDYDASVDHMNSDEDESEFSVIAHNLYENCENCEWGKLKDDISGTTITFDSIPEFTGNCTVHDTEGCCTIEVYNFFPQTV